MCWTTEKLTFTAETKRIIPPSILTLLQECQRSEACYIANIAWSLNFPGLIIFSTFCDIHFLRSAKKVPEISNFGKREKSGQKHARHSKDSRREERESLLCPLRVACPPGVLCGRLYFAHSVIPVRSTMVVLGSARFILKERLGRLISHREKSNKPVAIYFMNEVYALTGAVAYFKANRNFHECPLLRPTVWEREESGNEVRTTS